MLNTYVNSTATSTTAYSVAVILEACRLELAWIERYRAKKKEEYIQREMQIVRSKWFFFSPRNTTREEAEQIWKGDFWADGVSEFASDEENLRKLQRLVKYAPGATVNLSAQDIALFHSVHIEEAMKKVAQKA
jgi:hypothetical protein